MALNQILFFAVISFLVLVAFADPIFYELFFRIPSSDPSATREVLEDRFESLKLSDVEVVGHDGKFVYVAKQQTFADDLDSDFNIHEDVVDRFSKLMSSVDIADWSVLGRPGSIHPAALPPHFLESFNKRVPKGYTPPAKLRRAFESLAEDYDFVQWIDFAKEYANATSIEGRPIHALRINYNPTSAIRPSVLFVSCHHSRELITPEIALNLAEILLEGFDAEDDVVMKWLNDYDIWIVPVLNVDGHEHVWKHDNMWRKNRRPHKDGSFGVDLNRNYDLGWDVEGGSAQTYSETYRGAAPFSEPETFALKKLSEEMKFAKVMDFHSSGREVLIHYSRLPMPEIMKNFIASEGKKLADAAGYGTRVPSDDGEHQEWQIKVNTAYSFLVETGTSFQPAYKFAEGEVYRVLPLIKKFLDRPISIRGRVVDEQGNPVHASIVVEGIEWLLGETRSSHPKTGAYHLFLPAGDYNVKFTANGKSKVEKVIVSDDSTVSLDVQL